MKKFLFALTVLGGMIICNSAASYGKNLSALIDTTVLSFSQNEKNVQLINDSETILVRKGEILKIDLGETGELTQVRVHSSLGRLIKLFRDVNESVSMPTKDLQPGIYMVIIKRLESREIKRVLITEAE
jgi:hypothetical protein